MALGWPDGDDGELRAERVSGADRLQPAQLVDAWRAEAGHVEQQTPDEQAHEERRRMPAAGDQSAVHRLPRRLAVDVKRLRVEAPREFEDLVFADRVLAEIEDFAGAEIFQVPHAVGFSSRRRPRSV